MMIEICSDAASQSDSELEEVECTIPVKTLRQAGFLFPLQHEDDIERLEEVVKTNLVIRDEYVSKFSISFKSDPTVIGNCLCR